MALKPNTPEELGKVLAGLRMNALSFLRSVAMADANLLKAFGYGGMTNGEAVLAALKTQLKKIDDEIVSFEKRHPR